MLVKIALHFFLQDRLKHRRKHPHFYRYINHAVVKAHLAIDAGTTGVRWFFLWRALLRFAVPAFLIFVLWYAVPETYAAVAGLFVP